MLALVETGVDPRDVRLLRHQTELLNGRAPLELWHADPAAFEHLAHQLRAQRAWFESRYWAP